jgi:hypothetical protein
MAAQGAPLPSGPPSTASPDFVNEAAYAIGYQAGLIEGQRVGMERERAQLHTQESINERIQQEYDRRFWPMAHRAMDRAGSLVIYTVGAGAAVGFLWLVYLIIWRVRC